MRLQDAFELLGPLPNLILSDLTQMKYTFPYPSFVWAYVEECCIEIAILILTQEMA